MGFLLRENSYLLKCYPTIKVFCGLAVKHRGPEAEITGFSFWLCHKFPLLSSGQVLSSVPVSPRLCHCWGSGWEAGFATQGNSCHSCDVMELPQTWRVCCVRAGGDGRASGVRVVQTPGEIFLLCPTSGVCGVCESLLCGMSWAVPCPALGAADGANAAWDFPDLQFSSQSWNTGPDFGFLKFP